MPARAGARGKRVQPCLDVIQGGTQITKCVIVIDDPGKEMRFLQLAAVEIGKLLGATVIAAASSEQKLEVAKARGADHLVLYSREPFRDAVKRITDGRGADVVFDPVGGPIFEDSLRCIAWGARLLVIGFTGGIGLARTNLLLIKGASVLGVRAGEAARRNPALGAVRLKALVDWAEQGKIRPNVSHRVPLEDYAKAMRLLLERRAIGRVALVVG